MEKSRVRNLACRAVCANTPNSNHLSLILKLHFISLKNYTWKRRHCKSVGRLQDPELPHTFDVRRMPFRGGEPAHTWYPLAVSHLCFGG